jgi:RNA polymerase sigma-70 factor (ECF subfamily)
MSQPDPDLPLVRRCIERRCPESFAALYQRYRDRVFGTASALTGDRTLAEDVTQEVFLRVYRKLDTFEGKSSFGTWVYRLTINLATDLQRSRQRGRRLVDEVVEQARARPEKVVDDGSATGAGAEAGELRGQVAQAIRGLSEKLAAVVVLRYLEGLSYEEIAEALDMSVGTVKSRLNRAHGELAELLRPLRQDKGEGDRERDARDRNDD